MDDSEEVRRRADELARTKKANDDQREASRAAAVAELERLQERVDACLEGVPEIRGRWKTRVSTNYAILDFELQQVSHGRQTGLTWEKSAVVRSESEGVYRFEYDNKRYDLEEALGCIKDKAAYWIVHWRRMVEECEESKATAKAKYDRDLDERIANNRAGCLLGLVIIGGLLWFFLGQ